MSIQHTGPIRVARLNTDGRATDIPGIAAVELHHDQDPPYADGGYVRSLRPAGEEGCALVLPAGSGALALTPDQRAFFVTAMDRMLADFRRLAEAAMPLLHQALKQLTSAADALAPLVQDNGREKQPGRRRTGRAAQVSPYGPPKHRRPR